MSTQMRREIDQIPQSVARLLADGQAPIRDAAQALRRSAPQVIVTAARGSSDCVASYFKYACEMLTGVPVASVGPSVASVYHAPLHLPKAACLAVSQSGQSPDILALAQACGPLSVALVNDAASPLARDSAHPVDILAGPERAVAATKTVVNSAVSALLLLAHWAQDDALLAAFDALPAQLDAALQRDWHRFSDALPAHGSLIVLGRGPSLAMAQEVALKFKEVCGLHAEAFSSGEVLHGPAAIVQDGMPVLGLAAQDAAQPLLAQVCDRLQGQGARVFATAAPLGAATRLEPERASHPLLDPLLLIASTYAMVEAHARAMGRDPDAPPHLQKVTRTL